MLKTIKLWRLICSAILYYIIALAFARYAYVRGIFIRNNDITFSNCYKLTFVLLVIYLILPVACFYPFFKKGIIKRSEPNYGILVLAVIFYIISLLTSDMSFRSVYLWLKYLIFIGAGEEVLFRGFFYNILKERSPRTAVVLSGAFWGILHSLLTFIMTANMGATACVALSEFSGGIIAGLYFIFLYEESGTIFLPIIVHATLDYSGVSSKTGPLSVCVITTLVVILYLLKKRKKQNEI